MKFWAWALALGMLSGCASLSKDECRNADWYLIGFGDGSAGKTLNTVSKHRKACARVNISPNLIQYESGHKKGTSHYCTIENGFILGSRGGQYNGVCAGTTEAPFLEGYAAGRDRFDLQQAIDQLASHLDQHQERLSTVEAEILEHEAALVGTNSPSDGRRHHLQSLRPLQDEKTALEDDLSLMNYELIELHGQLGRLIQRQRAQGYP